MKILQISSAPISYSGGTEKVIWEISKRFSKKNEVTVLQTTLYEPTKIAETSYKQKVKIITCKNDYFLGGYGYSNQFKEKLKEIWKDYDVVHIQGYGRFTSDFSLKFLKNKKPIIFTAHGFFHSKKANFFKKMHYKIKGNLLKNASFCTALTELEREKYTELGVRKERINVIPNGVDIKKFYLKPPIKLKQKYSNGEKILLYVGRIHESKGLQYVLRAIKDIDLKFLIVGKDVGYKKELKKLVSKLEIKEKVKFVGEIYDNFLMKMYSIADIFILFSEWEGFGITVLEAMASGKPVIVSDRGALPTLVKNEDNGLIVKYRDIQNLKKKISELIENDKKREKMGQKGKEFSKKFEWDNIVKKYINIYKKSIGHFHG